MWGATPLYRQISATRLRMSFGWHADRGTSRRPGPPPPTRRGAPRPDPPPGRARGRGPTPAGCGGGGGAAPDPAPGAPEDRLAGELPRLDVRREDDDLVEGDL